jgi:uncharacterized protein YqeY
MNLLDQINDHLKQSLKNSEKTHLNVLRQLKTAISNASLQSGNINAVLPDEKILSLIRKQISQRQDSILQFEKAGRNELAQNEKDEISILEKYLPASLSPEEIQNLVENAIIFEKAYSKKDLGRVIKSVVESTKGAVDGKIVSSIAGKFLN